MPYCKCAEPQKYLLREKDILFARTGATTGKTHLVQQSPHAVFASYLIRVRTKGKVSPEYLYSFFQSNNYWSQILEEKEGSAQPNVNGQKLLRIQLPIVDDALQLAVSKFLEIVRGRQDGIKEELPQLPPPLAEQRRIVARVEELAAKIEAARGLRREAGEEAEKLWVACARGLFTSLANENMKTLRDVISVQGGGTPSKANPFFWDGGIPWISPKDMKSHEIHDAIDHISEEATRSSPAKLLNPGSVLIVVRGMILAHTVPSAILRIPATINQDMKALVPRNGLLPEYLCHALWALNQGMLAFVEKSTYDTRKLETPKLLQFAIPIPSIEEQHRIVAYLDFLQAKVDTLKALQAETQAELDALLPAVLDKAFKGEL